MTKLISPCCYGVVLFINDQGCRDNLTCGRCLKSFPQESVIRQLEPGDAGYWEGQREMMRRRPRKNQVANETQG